MAKKGKMEIGEREKYEKVDSRKVKNRLSVKKGKFEKGNGGWG